MRLTLLGLSLALVISFSLTTWLEPWFQSWAGNRTQSAQVLNVVLGDSRRLFAKHFYVKADAYYHNGYYPTIFDNQAGFEKPHITDSPGSSAKDEERNLDFMNRPRDWLDRFSRHFYPSRHTHLGDSGCGKSCCQKPHSNHDHDHDHAHDHDHDHEDPAKGAGREVLPWLRLSAELDPQRVETYVVSAYWLRRELGKVDEAEQFLREGLRANPGNPDILFELGRIHYEVRKDFDRARNLWEIALANWPGQEGTRPEPNILLYAQITSHLARLEEEQKNYSQAIAHLELLHKVSPSKDAVRKWIDEVKAKQGVKSLSE